MTVIILQYSIVTSDKISKDTEAANFVGINICVILKTFGLTVDPLQFAYSPNWSTDDAITITLLYPTWTKGTPT